MVGAHTAHTGGLLGDGMGLQVKVKMNFFVMRYVALCPSGGQFRGLLHSAAGPDAIRAGDCRDLRRAPIRSPGGKV
ncbi:MAG TPA: hypothetical protein VNA25_19075 [Phycisphaerae bacterium]|nr:hypothetical protein [Phycisphaerae bacterium]HUT59952.1 hypothetical protein [Phycisphaerae bacterium]